MSYQGVATGPKFPEALFVHCINDLDGKLNIMLDAIENDPHQDWTAFQSKFQTELLKK